MRYHDITHEDLKNGDGLRTILWVSGCNHHCMQCQNPITWDCNDGLIFDEKARKEIFDQLDKPYISGITLSGGDPLYSANLEEINKLVFDIKERYDNAKTIWIYSGSSYTDIIGNVYKYDDQRKEIINMCDVFVDGEFSIALKDDKAHWKGSLNQNVIDIPLSRKNNCIIIHGTEYNIKDDEFICIELNKPEVGGIVLSSHNFGQHRNYIDQLISKYKDKKFIIE